MLKRRIAIYISLVASMLVLLSVAVPHHHHHDGMPCYRWLVEAGADAGGSQPTGDTHPEADHGMACLGHNQALFSSVEQHSASDLQLVPLLVLFGFMDMQKTCTLLSPAYGRERAFYIESLHDNWLAKASGLRAPPSGVPTGEL